MRYINEDEEDLDILRRRELNSLNDEVDDESEFEPIYNEIDKICLRHNVSQTELADFIERKNIKDMMRVYLNHNISIKKIAREIFERYMIE